MQKITTVVETKLVAIADIQASAPSDKSNVEKIIAQFEEAGELPTVQINEEHHLLNGVDALEAAKQLEQDCLVVEVMSERGSSRIVVDIPVDLLRKHPMNQEIYGEDEDVSVLAQAIKDSGEIDPLTVHKEEDGRYTILRGNSRFKAVNEIIWLETLPCIVLENLDDAEQLTILLTGNVQREKTIEMKVREGLLWEQVFKKESKQRMGKKGAGAGPVRDLVAKKVGFGCGLNYERACAVVQAMDEGHPEAEKIRQIVQSPKGKVAPAHKLIAPKEEPKQFKSVEQELNHQQKAVGLGKSNDSQVLPSVGRNQGDPKEMGAPIPFKKPQPQPQQHPIPLQVLEKIKSEIIAEMIEESGGLKMTSASEALEKFIKQLSNMGFIESQEKSA